MTLYPSFFLDAGTPASGALLNFAPFILVIGIFYVLLFLPMQKQKKAQAKMLSELKSGDSVITTGGIVGTVTVVESDTLILRIKPDNLKLQFARSAVSALVPTDGAKEAPRAGSK